MPSTTKRQGIAKQEEALRGGRNVIQDKYRTNSPCTSLCICVRLLARKNVGTFEPIPGNPSAKSYGITGMRSDGFQPCLAFPRLCISVTPTDVSLVPCQTLSVFLVYLYTVQPDFAWLQDSHSPWVQKWVSALSAAPFQVGLGIWPNSSEC